MHDWFYILLGTSIVIYLLDLARRWWYDDAFMDLTGEVGD